MQKYHNKEITERLTGTNLDQAYLIIAYHLKGKLWHVSSVSKNPPLNYLNRWCSCHTDPNVQKKYVVMD